MGGPRWGLAAVLGLGALSLAACGGRQGDASAAQAVITDIGSDTMVNLALAWAEAYAKLRPEVRISVTGGGTGTGIGSLLNGTADMANASRAMKPEELEAARAQGIDAAEHVVARDAIAIIVHPDNPVRALSIPQLAAVFSGKVRNWKELGGHDRPIVRASREVNSGTHVYFLEAVVRQGRKKDKTLFAPDTLLLPSSEGIMAEVSQNQNAIGYDGLGYVTEAVGVVAVASADGGVAVAPSARTVQDRSYPIARDLFIYTRRNPPAAVSAYLAWIAGPAAQLIVRGLGFVPVE